jgi:uncharacterized protein (DUF1330 family)
MEVVNQLHPTPELAQAFFGATDDGPIVMVNLLKFKDKAEYADGSDADLSGLAAYLRYGAAVVGLLIKAGGRPIYSGPVTGIIIGDVPELWDMVALAEYPSNAAMMAMVESPEYRAIEHHRLAGLAGQLNIRSRPMTRPPTPS